MLLSLNSACFLLVPNEQNHRVLVPAKVVSVSGVDAVIQFEEEVSLEPGNDATIFAQCRGKFFQQAVKVTAMPVEQVPPAAQREASQAGSASTQATIAITCVGEPVSAESRGSYRVSIVASDLYATVAKQQKCLIVDVSPEGCAVICARPLTVGHTVDVGFTFEDVRVEGAMKVQTVRELPSGKLRFGLFASDKNSTVRQGLQKVSMAIQRAQLKRLAGAA